MRSFILKRPIACFIGLTFIISLVIGLPFKFLVLDHLFDNYELGFSYFTKFPVVYGPAISAVIITYLTAGRNGTAALFSKLKPYTIHIIWWIGLPFAGMGITVASFLAGGFSPGELVSYIITANPFLLLLHFVAAFVFMGIGEELGWRGWLLPKLANGRTIIWATMLTGLVWAFWHLPIYFISQKISITFVLLPLVISIVFSWLWDRVGGNVFVLAIAHASLEFPFAFFEGRIDGGHPEQVSRALTTLSAIYVILALAVYLLDRNRFSTILTQPNERLLE